MIRTAGRREIAWRPAGGPARAATAQEYSAPLSGGVQTRLQRCRPRAMRRHAARKAIRFTVLVTVDAVAALLAFTVCRAVGAGLLEAVSDPRVSLVQRFPSLSFVSI